MLRFSSPPYTAVLILGETVPALNSGERVGGANRYRDRKTPEAQAHLSGGVSQRSVCVLAFAFDTCLCQKDSE